MDEFIEYLMKNNKILCLEDNMWLMKNQQFKQKIKELEKSYDLIMFDENKYVNVNMLRMNGLSQKLVVDFCNCVKKRMQGKVFSVDYLNKINFCHEIYDFGFENKFYESILKNSDKFEHTKHKGKYLFKVSKNKISVGTLVLELIQEKGTMEIFDLTDYINNTYGLNAKWNELRNFAQAEGLYYSDTMEKVYMTYEDFFEELEEVE